MNQAFVLLVSSAFVITPVARPADLIPLSRRIEARVETAINREGGEVTPCEVAEFASVTRGNNFVSWSTIGEVERSDGSSYKLRGTACRCGKGAFPSASLSVAGSEPVPFLVNEISLVFAWDSGTMDPGPGNAVQAPLMITTRRLTGFASDGRPLYTNPVADHRSIRFEAGEEFVVPVLVTDAMLRESTGIHEVLVRVRAWQAGRPGAVEYGSIDVIAAAPGSEILLDGGIAGHVGNGGTSRLANVPIGLREVRIRAASGQTVFRHVVVAKGKTVAVSPDLTGGGTPALPSVTLLDKNAQGFLEYRRKRDGAVMVQIPEGEFLMGNLNTEGAPLPHTVYVSSFLMDKLPVTVGRYKLFAAATGRPLPPDPYWGVHDDFPVAFVRWDESKAYCEWAGGRLPTEAEREKATRGTDGRMWPWGSEPPPNPAIAVFRRNWGEEGNDAAGIRLAGASPYGLLDTGGNMWEYCEDWWDSDYFKVSPPKDPRGPRTGRAHVVKGGSWDSRPSVLSASSRNFAYVGYREGDFGFRCAADPPR